MIFKNLEIGTTIKGNDDDYKGKIVLKTDFQIVHQCLRSGNFHVSDEHDIENFYEIVEEKTIDRSLFYIFINSHGLISPAMKISHAYKEIDDNKLNSGRFPLTAIMAFDYDKGAFKRVNFDQFTISENKNIEIL